MRVLVTGHSGLIGSHLVDRLIAQGHEVYGISTTERNQNPKCVNMTLDLKDEYLAAAAVEAIKPELVYHCAANAAEGKSMFSPIDITTNGINTFYNVLVPAIKAGALKRFVFTSSIAVYGAIHVPFRESDLPLPQDIYGINKLATEQALRAMSDVHNFEFVIVRPHNVFGEKQRMDDPYRNVIALWMNQLLKGEPYTIYGDGSMKRCFSYVGDVVDVLTKCGFEDVAGMTLNVGSDKFYSLSEISHLLQNMVPNAPTPNYLPSRVHEVHTAVSDHTLVRKVLGYKDTPIELALALMWQWAEKQGAQAYAYDILELDNIAVPQNWK